MACGAPVLTTHRASLPEVGGDAVAYTEPDAPSIGAALRDLLTAPSRRAALAAAGQARAQEFSWAASASVHLASYKKAAEDSSDGVAASLRAGLVP
jgi:glycosyltransferase involved in cell wall biosynthesis